MRRSFATEQTITEAYISVLGRALVIREEHIDLGQSGVTCKANMLARVELDGDPDGAVRLQKAFKGMMSRTPAIAKRVNISMFDNKDDVGAAGPRIALGNLGVETIRRY